jgi:hypothetical protein
MKVQHLPSAALTLVNSNPTLDCNTHYRRPPVGGVGRGREAAEAARAYAAPWWPVGQAIAVGMTLRWVRLAFALVGSERAERAARTRKI